MNVTWKPKKWETSPETTEPTVVETPDYGAVDPQGRPVVVPPYRVEDHRVRRGVVYPVGDPARDRIEDERRDEEPGPGHEDGDEPEGCVAGAPQDQALDGDSCQRPVRYVAPGVPGTRGPWATSAATLSVYTSLSVSECVGERGDQGRVEDTAGKVEDDN